MIKVRLNSDGTAKVLQSRGELVIQKDSVATSSAVWFVYPFSAAKSLAPEVGKSPHPIWGGLYCKSYTIKKAGAGAIITAQFEGSEYQWDSEKDSEENTVEVAATMREEPIETHPKFKDWIAEKEGGLSVAIFDDDGNFKTWNKDTKLGSELLGVKSYYVPGYSATVTFISKARPSLGGIGSIGGGGGIPGLGEGREWMKTGISYSSLADGTYKVTETYLSSGEKGWNEEVYKK